MKKLTLILAAILVSAAMQGGNLKTAHIFSDHMVLQRETSAPIWGWGEAGKTVAVKTSWNGKTYRTAVGDDGKWRVSISTAEAGGPYSITVKSGKERVEIADVFLGEVWICSGQSNMEMPVGGFGFQELEGSNEAIMEASETSSLVRVFDIRTDKKTEPIEDVEAQWELTTPGVTAKTSAIGYFFGKRLAKILGMRVGIIVNPWGGSRIEPWMTRETIEGAGIPAEDLKEIYSLKDIPGRWPEIPELIWNGRVAPIVGYAAKGILWYQGCSNILQKSYDKLQAAMVRQWREAWGLELPFIYTLLAPYGHSMPEGRWRPRFVETQLRTEELVPACWAISTETLGSEVSIHPPKKKEIADMMVLRALKSVYDYPSGITAIDLPRLKSVKYLEDGTAVVHLTRTKCGLGSISSRDVVGFELAGEDRVFHLAEARIDMDGQTIRVRCKEVPHPIALRYSFRNWMGANLQKSNGIPVPPFRTDDWDD